MIQRLSLWGVGLLVIVLAAQVVLRGRAPAEQSPRVEPPREELPAADVRLQR